MLMPLLRELVHAGRGEDGAEAVIGHHRPATGRLLHHHGQQFSSLHQKGQVWWWEVRRQSLAYVQMDEGWQGRGEGGGGEGMLPCTRTHLHMRMCQRHRGEGLVGKGRGVGQAGQRLCSTCECEG